MLLGKKSKMLYKNKNISERCFCNGLPPRGESLGARRPFVLKVYHIVRHLCKDSYPQVIYLVKQGLGET